MKPELLAPVNKDTLDTAIAFGADAVYFGVTNFNARRRANNFTNQDLKRIIPKCHKEGVKAYLTLNTLIKNNELNLFFDTLKEAYETGIDAVIIQDISLIEIIRKNFPKLEIHLSTQTAITNIPQLQSLPKVDRLILPRELSLKEIEAFSKVIPTEVFIQGALCYSYSGLCLLSSFAGSSRSGNRGLCSQLCRKKYNKKYSLSMKDLCTIENIPELIKAGVKSFKIEGRLRSERYLAEAIKAYREAIEGNTPDITALRLAFNRGFTKGFAFQDTDHINPNSPENQGIYLGEVDSKKEITLKIDIEKGEGLRIIREDRKNGAKISKIFLKDKLVTKAKKGNKISLDLFLEPGDKIYKTSPARESKSDYKNNKPEIKTKINKVNIKLLPIENKHLDKTLLLVKTYTKEEAEKALKAKADRVFYSIFNEDYSNKFGAYIPRILSTEEINKAETLLKKHKPNYILLGNIGITYKAKEIYIDYTNNCFNDLDVQYLNKKGIPILSPELSKKEILNFKDQRFGILAHGDIPVIQTKNRIKKQTMKDEKGFIFKVRKELNTYQLLSARPLGIFDEILDLEKNNIRIFLLDLDKKVQSTVRIYRDIIDNKKTTSERMKKGHTVGHFEIGVS